MAKIDLTKYGITGTTEIVYNPSYEMLFEEETKPGLEGFEKGRVSELGAVNVMTGIYTGRSPKDKYIVMDENSKDTVWWTSDEYKNDNHPASQEAWEAVKEIAKKELSDKRLFVVDAFCGANKDTRMAIRFIVEVAWQAHFVTNMFIQPTEEELKDFEPDFVVYNASKAKVENYKELGLNSETAVMFNITSREQVIVNTWYGGEMKKGMFSMMNYYLPLKGIASAFQEQVRLHFPQILRDSLSVMMSTAGTTTECSTSRAVAMLRLSTLTRILSRIFTMQSREMLFLRTLHLTQKERLISLIRALQRTLVYLIRSTTLRKSFARFLPHRLLRMLSSFPQMHSEYFLQYLS